MPDPNSGRRPLWRSLLRIATWVVSTLLVQPVQPVIIKIDIFTPIPTGRDVIQRPGKLYPQWSGHAARISIPLPKCWDGRPDPGFGIVFIDQLRTLPG